VRPRRPHPGRRAVPGRDRRLADLPPLALRGQGACALGDRHPDPPRRPLRRRTTAPARFGPRCSGPTTASSSASPRRPRSCRWSCCCPTPTRSRPRSSRRCRAPRRSLPASVRRPPVRCCCRDGDPTSAPRCGSSVSAPPTCWAVASRYPSFPILLEATRECCNDVFDLPALRRCSSEVRSRRIRVVQVETPVGLAVRPVAAVRLDRGVHVRRRRTAGRTARRGPGARPGAAARPARRRGAAVAARRGGVDQVELELQRFTPERAARDPTRPTTWSGCSGRSPGTSSPCGSPTTAGRSSTTGWPS
jgi:hypothetical protein